MTDLGGVVAALIARGEDRRAVTLEDVATVFDALAPTATADDIGQVIDAIEQRGFRVERETRGAAREDLRAVLAAARALTAQAGRRPTVHEIAARTGLEDAAVRTALALARVLARGPAAG